MGEKTILFQANAETTFRRTVSVITIFIRTQNPNPAQPVPNPNSDRQNHRGRIVRRKR